MNPNQRGAIVISWDGIRTGREGKGMTVFAESMQFNEELEKEGRIAGSRVYIYTTGSGGGQVILDGLYTELQDLLTDDNFTRVMQSAALVCEGFQVNLAVGGAPDTLAEGMGNYVQLLTQHGLLT